jgi:hypothetical protein
MTDVQPGSAPSSDGLFGNGFAPERPDYRKLTAVRLLLALVAIGFTIGLILLGIVVGIRTLIG